MTENERLNEALEDFEMFCKGKILCVTGEALEMIRTAIKEREQYRAISTIEECKNNKVLADKRYEHFFDGMEQLEKYKAIGTVEEFKDLKEKNEPKKPKDRYKTKNIWDAGYCPTCGCGITSRWDYCQKCSQHVDWQ